MPRTPNFDEANMLDKPQVVADRPRLSAERVAGIEENWRQELEALQAVDDGVARVIDTLDRTGELANTLSCSPPTTASCTANTAPRRRRC